MLEKIEFLINCATHESSEVLSILIKEGIHPENKIKNVINVQLLIVIAKKMNIEVVR